MNIKHITYLLLFTTSVSVGMEKLPDFNSIPFTIDNELISYIRQQLRKANDKADINQIIQLGNGNITIQEIISSEKRYGICHNYALSKLMGIIGDVPKTFKNFDGKTYYALTEINILEHFNQVEQPQAGDLALYISNNILSSIFHTGIVTDDGNIESKWCLTRAIFKHHPWYIPSNYGTQIVFFRPNITGYELLNAVQAKLQNQQIQQTNNKVASILQQQFLSLASHNYSTTSCDKNFFAHKMDNMLQFHMNIHPNMPDKHGRTALMLAAHVGDENVVNVLLQYKVRVNKQDKNGNTALMYAAINGHTAIKNKLIENGAKTGIKTTTS